MPSTTENFERFPDRLRRLQRAKQSQLCVGIDPEPEKLPRSLGQSPEALRRFCAAIIEATAPYATAFKFNFAFFEALGERGWRYLHELRQMVPADCLKIADAKRGDIGNSARLYARAVFDQLGFDAVTANPYMGSDAAAPFLAYRDRGVYFLCLTSNPAAVEVQGLRVDGEPLYLQIARLVARWNAHGNCGLVAGATKPAELQQVHRLAPELPLLVPGIGAQGGSLEEILQIVAGTPALIAVSRTLLYASQGDDFAAAAEKEARSLQELMASAVRW